MSTPVSRNRQDYSPEVQALVTARALVFLDGDIDRSWEEFFAELEKIRSASASDPKTPVSAEIILRATKPPQ